jgi:hypothetical protein
MMPALGFNMNPLPEGEGKKSSWKNIPEFGVLFEGKNIKIECSPQTCFAGTDEHGLLKVRAFGILRI